MWNSRLWTLLLPLSALAQPPSGLISTAAGTPTTAGFYGDGGQATSAQLDRPVAIAFSASGNLYIADTGNSVIRRVATSGVITTFAGNRTEGYSGDGGPATSAALNGPNSIALDSAGNLYIADTGNHVIRKVSNGTITTVAGTGTSGYNGDGIAANTAKLNMPIAIAVDSAGNLYIADAGNFRIRKVSNGVITTIAGTGKEGQSGDNGPATSAQVRPGEMVFDANDNLFFAGLPTSLEPLTWGPALVRQISGGTITRVSGVSEHLKSAFGLTISPAGNLVISDPVGGRVYERLTDGSFRILAGSGTPGFAGDGGGATSAQIGAVLPLYDVAGNLYLSDLVNSCVRVVHFPGSMAQIASAGTWATTIATVNLGATNAEVATSFFDEAGSPLTLPFTFPQDANASYTGSTLTSVLAPYAIRIAETTGPDAQPANTGWAELRTTGNVTGYAIFNNPFYKWSALVPLETRNADSYVLLFDNTAPLATGVAIANMSPEAVSVNVTVRDDTGATLRASTIDLPGCGHTQMMLDHAFPETANKRGIVKFDTPANAQISVLGLRANGTIALTTLPVLANVTASGGSISHATFNGGFTSIFYLVNMDETAADATVSFFDELGNPLTVPLFFPQTGSAAKVATVTHTIQPDESWLLETQSQDKLASVVGSAQISTTGKIAGFETFRWTTYGQEATVPLETRAAARYIIVFDNIGDLSTGVALANVDSQKGGVLLAVRDDAGKVLKTDTINVPAHGHTSFMLPEKYPEAAGHRGTMEFFTPTGGRISVIGLRAKADGTLTTIPVLVK